MPYVGLGRKRVDGVLDSTGLNTGNWTNVFDVRALGAKVPYYEIYKVVVTNALPGLPGLTWYQGNEVWSSVQLAGNAEWDPTQPLLMTPADETFFCWNVPYNAAVTAPRVTAWLRYDPTINPNPGRY